VVLPHTVLWRAGSGPGRGERRLAEHHVLVFPCEHYCIGCEYSLWQWLGTKLKWGLLDPIGGMVLSSYIMFEWVKTLLQNFANRTHQRGYLRHRLMRSVRSECWPRPDHTRVVPSHTIQPGPGDWRCRMLPHRVRLCDTLVSTPAVTDVQGRVHRRGGRDLATVEHASFRP